VIGEPEQTIRREFHGRLFSKYARVFILLVSGALLLSSLLELLFAYQEQRSALVRLQQEKAAVAATRIGQFIDETVRQIQGALPPGSASNPLSIDERRTEFLRLLRLAPAVSQIRYVNADGREREVISRFGPNAYDTLEDRSGEAGFAEALPERPYFGPVTFRSESEPYMRIALRDPSVGGGVVLADVNLKFMWDVIARSDVGSTGDAYVVDNHGILVAHPNISLVLQKTDLSTLPQVAAVLDANSDGSSHEGVAVDGTPSPMLTAHARIDSPGWWVFVDEQLGVALAPLYASVLRTVGLVVGGVLLSVLVSLLLARQMVKPIQALRIGAARLGAGELDHQIDVRTGDELEALALEFNLMAEQLQTSYAQLEDKVAERTSDLVDALHEVAAARQAAEIANQHKSEFLANMSHELRTPLFAIIGISEMMADGMFGDITAKQADYLRDVLTAGQHLLSLINDILDLTKVEAGRMELDESDFALAEVLANGVSVVREWAIREGLEVHLDVRPDVGIVRGDERKVRQVVFNLLSNAVRFTPSGGRIDVLAWSDAKPSGSVVVAVRDTGVGIAPDEQERIFDQFYQVKDSRTRGGTGLGLALSRKLIELHQGELWVDSQPGHGSTFSFRLPRHQSLAPAPAGTLLADRV